MENFKNLMRNYELLEKELERAKVERLSNRDCIDCEYNGDVFLCEDCAYSDLWKLKE